MLHLKKCKTSLYKASSIPKIFKLPKKYQPILILKSNAELLHTAVRVTYLLCMFIMLFKCVNLLFYCELKTTHLYTFVCMQMGLAFNRPVLNYLDGYLPPFC